MGFFKDMFGITSETDWPDMERFKNCMCALYSCYLQLEYDHGARMLHEMRVYFAMMFAWSAIQEPRQRIEMMPMGYWQGLLAFVFGKGSSGGRFCNEPIETVALHGALLLCEWKAESETVFNHLASRNRGIYQGLKDAMNEQGRIDADMYSFYCDCHLNDFSRLDADMTGAAMRCKELGII